MFRVGIDLSLRSTGICILRDGLLYDFEIIDHKTIHDEELILENGKDIFGMIRRIHDIGSIDSINIEGLSFGSISGSKDILAGNMWNLRCLLHKNFYDKNIVPVSQWRAKVINSADRKEMKMSNELLSFAKIKLKGLIGPDKKEHQKIIKTLGKLSSIKERTFQKLPEYVQFLFKEYIEGSKRSEGQSYDLGDAYFLAKYEKLI